jgi:hypothetical protein
MKDPRPDRTLERLLLIIERELLAASPEEVAGAARELGIKPQIKGSMAFVGVTQLVLPRGWSRLRPVHAHRASRSQRGSPKDDAPTPD